MASSINVIVLALFVFFVLVVMAMLVVFQLYLERKKTKWLVIALPFISFFASVGITAYYFFFNNEYLHYGFLLITFLSANIPTLILTIVHLVAKEKLKRTAQLEKMKIQDL